MPTAARKKTEAGHDGRDAERRRLIARLNEDLAREYQAIIAYNEAWLRFPFGEAKPGFVSC